VNLDRYFSIGRQHIVCQDYALVDSLRGAAFLSDGCSSSPATDFGARFLCLAAAQEFAETGGLHPNHIMTRAWAMARMAELPDKCLDSTLLAILPVEGGIRALAYGDGTIAARRREDGVIEYHSISCPGGAPDYLHYTIDPMRQAGYLQEFRGPKTSLKVVGDEIQETLSHEIFNPVEVTFSKADYDLVAVVSDGVLSFQRPDGTSLVGVPTHEVLAQIMGIKGGKGDFVVRRVRNGFLNRFCVKNGWHHYDDLSVAAVYLGDPDE